LTTGKYAKDIAELPLNIDIKSTWNRDQFSENKYG